MQPISSSTPSVLIMLLTLMAVSKARISSINQRDSKLWMCEKDNRIVTLYPGDKINIYGPNLRRKYQTKQKCNIILQASNVNSTVNIRCWSFGVKNPTRQNKCRHFLQINAEKYCVKKIPTVHDGKYSKAKLKFVTRSQFSSSGFSCSAEVPKLNESKPDIVTKFGAQKCRCGKVKYKTRIVGGVETRVRSHPWMASIVQSFLRIPFCGGTLINDRWVMTAAHCFYWYDYLISGFRYKVMLLEHAINKLDGEMAHHIKRIIAHPEYKNFRDGNDIALIELWTPVNFERTEARPVCLPSTTSRLYYPVNATVVGWGRTSWYAPASNVQKEVVIPTMSNAKCNQIYRFRIKNNMICAGYKDKGNGGCLGDSGGPLLTKENEHYAQIGILSFATDSTWSSPGCNSATGYTRVTAVQDWIEQTSKNGVTCES